MCDEKTKKMLNSGRMMAANLHAVGELIYEEVDIPPCGEDEVMVKVKNCGICGSDIGRVLAHGTYHFPTIPGHEFAGEVVYDATGEYTGKRVAVFPILPCFQCDMCAKENYAECRNYDYYGSRRDGGYAQFIAVKKWNLVELPDNVSFEEGAMCEPVSVARHAMKKLDIKEGETLLITGAGPIGLIAGMWAKSFGAARVCYIDIDEEKIAFAKSLGFEAYDGTWNSVYASFDNDWQESLKAVSEGRLNIRQLITHRPSIEEAPQTIRMMRDRTEFYCKVVIDSEK